MKALIIEDESLVARQLQAKIINVAKDVEILAMLPSIKAARSWFAQNAEPDLIFMDIQLGDGLSFELFDYFQLSCPVIFTTAYDEYALRAFKVNSIDYIVKPVDETDLQKAIDKYRLLTGYKTSIPMDVSSLLKALSSAHPPQTHGFKETFIVTSRQQWVPVKTKDIACFNKDSILMIYTLDGQRHLLENNSLEEIEELLDPQHFFRANRQYIISHDAIHRIQLNENQKLTLILKPPLKIQVDISREKSPAFKKWFDR